MWIDHVYDVSCRNQIPQSWRIYEREPKPVTEPEPGPANFARRPEPESEADPMEPVHFARNQLEPDQESEPEPETDTKPDTKPEPEPPESIHFARRRSALVSAAGG